jgi:hypothetical protein
MKFNEKLELAHVANYLTYELQVITFDHITPAPVVSIDTDRAVLKPERDMSNE